MISTYPRRHRQAAGAFAMTDVDWAEINKLRRAYETGGDGLAALLINQPFAVR